MMKALDFTGACIQKGDFVAFVDPEDGRLHRGVVDEVITGELVGLTTMNGNGYKVVEAMDVIVEYD